jgi:nitrogen fixation NifU-like protein
MSEASPYDQFILDHIKNARNYRALTDASHHAAGINPLCGDEMNVYAAVIDDCIVDLGFQCSCCGISMASASVMTELVKALPLVAARQLLRTFIGALGSEGPAVAHGLKESQIAILAAVRALPSRRKCAALPWLTLEAALNGHAQAASIDFK